MYPRPLSTFPSLGASAKRTAHERAGKRSADPGFGVFGEAPLVRLPFVGGDRRVGAGSPRPLTWPAIKTVPRRSPETVPSSLQVVAAEAQLDMTQTDIYNHLYIFLQFD